MSLSTEPSKAEKACGFESFLDIYRGLGLFAGASLEVCKVLAYLSQDQSLAPGETLVRQGERQEAFHYLTCGRVLVVRQAEEREVEFKILGPGESIGGLGLILGRPALYTLRALEDTQTMTLPREKFLKTLERFPQLHQVLLQSLAAHVLAWEERFLAGHPGALDDLGQDAGLTLF